MRHRSRIIWVLLASLALSGCQPSATPTPNIHASETQIASSIFATQTASAPTPTGAFTPTRALTPTSAPTLTLTPSPTAPATPTASSTAAPTLPVTEVIVTSTVEPGWTLYELQTSKFAVAIPSRWTRLDLSATGLETSLAAIAEANPNYKGALSSQMLRGLVASGVKFYAIDLTSTLPTSAYPVNMNILKVDTGIALPLDALVPATAAQLGTIADSSVPVTHRRITLSALEAEEFQYRNKVNSASGTLIVVATTQYVAVQGTIEYVITLISPLESADANAPVFEKIAQGFHIIP